MKVPSSLFRIFLTVVQKGSASVLIAGLVLGVSPLTASAAITADMTLHPVAEGNFKEWSANTGDKVQAVLTRDFEASYITTNTLGNSQTFVLENATVPTGSIINSVSLYIFAKKVEMELNVDQANNPRMALRIENSTSSVSDGDEFLVDFDNENYKLYGRYMALNPLTGAPWTESEVNSWTTAFGVTRTNEGGYTYIEGHVTKVWADVNYTTVDGTNGGGSGSTLSTSTLAVSGNELSTITFTASSTVTGSSTFSFVGAVPEGMTIDAFTGAVTWVPTETQGPAVYTVIVQAINGATIINTVVTVTVLEVNAVPVATPYSLSTTVNTQATSTLLGSDTDIPAQTLTYTIGTTTTHGVLSFSSSTVVYTPELGYTGADSFTYTVSDGISTSTPATVTITVGSQSTSGGSSSGSGSSSVTSSGGYFVSSNGGPLAQGGSSGSVGQVLGASTSCGIYIDKYLRVGYDNDVETVKKVQTFLNSHLGVSIPVTGHYGLMTEKYVKELQLKHKEVMLTPWNITEPTGIVYLTTVAGINNIMCPDLRIPVPTDRTPFSDHMKTKGRLYKFF